MPLDKIKGKIAEELEKVEVMKRKVQRARKKSVKVEAAEQQLEEVKNKIKLLDGLLREIEKS
jgi:lipid II:glycine glycyltransferase (peptidoglycan interpeptide bridge formation enzyme)